MKISKVYIPIVAGLFLAGCTGMNRTGENETEAGTTVTNNVNSDMEQHRTTSDVDTLISPGSNAMDIKKNNTGVSNQGTNQSTGNERTSTPSSGDKSVDKNMQGQSSTHGKSTESGDN